MYVSCPCFAEIWRMALYVKHKHSQNALTAQNNIQWATATLMLCAVSG